MEEQQGIPLLEYLQKEFEQILQKYNINIKLEDAIDMQLQNKDILKLPKIDINKPIVIYGSMLSNWFTNLWYRIYNYSWGWIINKQKQYIKGNIIYDIIKIINTLVDIHGYQIFHNGFYNTDPHPGNILLLHDNGLGLVDYGQVKRISRHSRALLAGYVHRQIYR